MSRAKSDIVASSVARARNEALREACDFAGKLAFEHEAAGRRMQAATAATIANEINNMIHGVGKYRPENAPHSLPAPAATGAGEPASPRAPSSLRAGWQRLTDSLLGDAIGLASIIVIFLVFIFTTA